MGHEPVDRRLTAGQPQVRQDDPFARRGGGQRW